jgi:hypothetical protein
VVADTWDTHSREDVVERAVSSTRSRTDRTSVQDVRDAHAVRYSWWLILEKPPSSTDSGFSTGLGLKTRWLRFRRESEAARGVIANGASR